MQCTCKQTPLIFGIELDFKCLGVTPNVLKFYRIYSALKYKWRKSLLHVTKTCYTSREVLLGWRCDRFHNVISGEIIMGRCIARHPQNTSGYVLVTLVTLSCTCYSCSDLNTRKCIRFLTCCFSNKLSLFWG